VAILKYSSIPIILVLSLKFICPGLVHPAIFFRAYEFYHFTEMDYQTIVKPPNWRIRDFDFWGVRPLEEMPSLRLSGLL
jgi:hypothetical protein